MYLENSEKHNISGAGELSAEAMLTEQCQVARVTGTADLSSASKGSAELGITVLVEYPEQTNSRQMDSSVCLARDETEAFTYCNGHPESFEQHPASSGVLESDHIADNCETSELSQPCDECAQLCECFKPCKCSELCANDSLTSTCNCCEPCVEHLQLFQQCEPLGRRCEHFDLEPDEPLMNCDSFNQYETSGFVAENPEQAEELQQYEASDEQYEDFDFETSETTDSTPDLSDLVDLPDCSAEFCECDDIQNQSESESACDDYDDLESCPPELREANDEEDVSSLYPYCYTPVDICSDDGELVCTANECSDECEGTEEQQATTSDMSPDRCDTCGNEDLESDLTEQIQGSDKTSEFGTEEESFSDCSSLETKSFTTCPDGSIPSDHCSDSSGESDKVVQEELSDEQTQWESFEEDEQTEQVKTNESTEEEKKMPTSDIVIEDYFDYFDKDDYCRHQFSQKQHYISCFDGGDIDDGLHVEEESQKSSAERECTFEEKAPYQSHVYTTFEDACDFTSGESDSESEKNPEDWNIDLESSLADNDNDDDEECEGEEYAPDYEDEASVSEGDFCEDCEEEDAEVCPSSEKEESMCAPCADDIAVEGDAYEDDACDANSYESLGETTADPVWVVVTDCNKHREPSPKDETFVECSEMEPYWLLQGNEPDVEEYYACEIRSIQSGKQALNDFITEGQCDDQIIPGNINGYDSGRDAPFSLKDFGTAGICPDEQATDSLTITELTGLAEDLSNCSVTEKNTSELTPISDQDDGLHEGSVEVRAPQGVIHSVLSEGMRTEGKEGYTEDSWASEHSGDAEEEPSDESFDHCECEYCIPPAQQVPAQPLLPRMKANDVGKICVVLDLDETLVHSSFKPVNNADFIIPVEIDGTVHQVYVLKRPHVDEFLKRMGELFECVLFTASLAKYADPVSDLLDKWGVFRSRLFRESCVFHKGNYVKDLSRLGRDLNKVIIIDNSPASYVFHPDNAVPVASWFDDMSDTELLDLIPFFESISKADDIYTIVKQQRTTS